MDRIKAEVREQLTQKKEVKKGERAERADKENMKSKGQEERKQ